MGGEQVTPEQRRVVKEREMQNIFEMWDWHYFDKVRQLDTMTRHITKEFSMCGVPSEMWVPFMQEQLADAIAQCAEQAKAEADKAKGEKRSRQPSSLVALRQKRRNESGTTA
jgi:hypothetical protein